MKLTLDCAKDLMDKMDGSLDLRGTQITALPDNLTVGGWLDLSGTQITALPDNMTVGGWLDLRGTQITALPDNLTVGGSLYLSGTQITHAQRKKVKHPNDGEYRPGQWLYADGILTHVRKTRSLGQYTVYVGKIKGSNVVSDGKNFAHCDDIRKGIADLLFKSARDRGAEQYKDLDLDTEMTVDEMVTMYRIITGACSQGSARFVDGVKDKKERYTIREAINITKGQYGAEAFAGFFSKN